MKLYYSPTSPYARKTRVIAREKGLADRVEEILVNTRDPAPEFLGHTPIGKIPTLVTDDGAVIVESTTIGEYLDQIGSGPSLAGGAKRFEIMGRTGIAQGVIDAVYSIAMEKRRPAELQWPEAIEKREAVLARTLPLCKVEAGRFDLGDITLACGLGYMDLRAPQVGWRSISPTLAAWYEEVSARPSMQGTPVG